MRCLPQGRPKRKGIRMDKEQAKKSALLAYKALDDKKGEDINIIDISGVSVLADYFIIASGSNRNQVQAMSDNVEEMLGKAGIPCRQIEGYQAGEWILLDFGDIVIHIFSREDRRFYDLERIWRDGKFLTKEELEEESSPEA